MVTAILDVGMGRLKLSNIEKMLSVPNWHHPLASTMVPACGNEPILFVTICFYYNFKLCS